ncbi:hypothetical protein K0U83_25585 [bacterium]|nr:hypothetical protein [bacterium]
MAVKSNFAAGDVLTASNVNTYLTNGGLVYIAEGSATNTSALDVNSVFSSTYDNYRVVLQTASRSTLQYARFQFRTVSTLATTNYASRSNWWNLTQANSTFQDYDQSAASITGGPSGDQSLNRWSIWTFDISNPNKAQQTGVTGSGTGVRRDDNWYSWVTGGIQADSTQFTGLRFIPNGGTFDVIYKIFGYRQA